MTDRETQEVLLTSSDGVVAHGRRLGKDGLWYPDNLTTPDRELDITRVIQELGATQTAREWASTWADMLAEARREGAEQAWDEGVDWCMTASGQFTGDPPNPYRNPFCIHCGESRCICADLARRADKIAKGDQ